MKNLKIYAFADEASAQIDKQIEAVKKNALNGIEIRNVDGVNVSDIPLEKAVEVRQKLDKAGIRVWSIGSPIGKIGIDDDLNTHLKKLEHTLEIAKILSAEVVRIFSFYIPKGSDTAQYTQRVLEGLSKFLELARPYGITLCHENEKGIYGDTAERCLEIHKALPEIKGVFDPANFIQCHVDTKKAWQLLKPYIKYLHIKDALQDGFVVPAGKGIGNLSLIVSEFIADGGSEVTIEPHLCVFEGLSDLERDGEETKIAFRYPDSSTAFDAACSAFKNLL